FLPWNEQFPGIPVPTENIYDIDLLENGDHRNVADKFRYIKTEEIKNILDQSRIGLHIAIENWTHDFNIGSIVRTANAFNVAGVHIIGRKAVNLRGAMMTDKYLDLNYYKTFSEFEEDFAKPNNLPIYGIDCIEGSVSIETTTVPRDVIFLYGNESDGLTEDAVLICEKVLHINQKGSTRSINAGHAAAIAMYEYTRQFNK
ncbi:MAG: TrmH family RNA methyltransferase, partial [Bifidobacteriaceae bacterium]|nr:TrmH family RNA methyltransferase [Bifidobacteriaceae bacterium]